MARKAILLLVTLDLAVACSTDSKPQPAEAASSLAVDAPGGTAVVGSPVVVTVTLKDHQGRPLPPWNVHLLVSGSRNTLGASAGSTDAAGQWKTTVTSEAAERKALTVQVARSADGDPAASPRFELPGELTFGPGPMSATASGAVPSPARVLADGLEATAVLFTARDTFGNPVPGLPVTAVAAASDVVSPATGVTSASGTFRTAVSSEVVGFRSITFTAAGSDVVSDPIEFAQPPPALSTSILQVDPPGAAALAGTPVAVSVLLKDAQGRPVPSWNVSLTSSGSRNTLSAAVGSTDTAGLWQATLTSQTAERKALTAQVAASQGGDPATVPLFALAGAVTFGPGPVSAATSGAVPSPAQVPADGRQTSTVLFTARDAFGNLVPGVQVSASGVTGADLVTPRSGVSSAAGTFQVTVASNRVGTRSLSFAASGLSIPSDPIQFAQTPWTAINRGRWGGFVRMVAVPPAGGPAGLVYAATPAGAYRSTDGGASWVPASLGIQGGDVRGLAVASVDGSVVLASVLGGPDGSGVYWSDDGASTWRSSLVGAGLVQAPLLTATWAASGQVTLQALLSESGPTYRLARSTDLGVSWTMLAPMPNLGSQVPSDLVGDPRSGTVYVLGSELYRFDGSTWALAGTGLPLGLVSLAVESTQDPSVVWVGTNGQGVYRGTGAPSAGLAFVQTAGGALGLPSGAAWFGLATDPVVPGTAYASSSSQVYRTTDAGATWHVLPALGLTDWVERLLIDPKDPSVGWFADGRDNPSWSGGPGLWRSRDLSAPRGGATASPAVNGIDAEPGALLALRPGVAGTLAVASDSVHQSTDGGATWVDLLPTAASAGLAPGQWTGVGYDAAGSLYAANGPKVVRLTGSGPVTVATLPFVPSHFAVSPVLVGTFFVADYTGAMRRCSDPCSAWSAVELPPGFQASRLAFASAAATPSPPVYGYSWTGAARSDDGGLTFRSLTALEGIIIARLAVDPLDGDRILIGPANGGLYLSSDGGATFKTLGALFDATAGVVAAIDARLSPPTIYAATSDGASRSTLHRSTDGGTTWARAGMGLDGTPLATLVADVQAPGRVVYAGGWLGGLFRTETGGD